MVRGKRGRLHQVWAAVNNAKLIALIAKLQKDGRVSSPTVVSPPTRLGSERVIY